MAVEPGTYAARKVVYNRGPQIVCVCVCVCVRMCVCAGDNKTLSLRLFF